MRICVFILWINLAQSSLFCIFFGKKYAGLKKVRQLFYRRYWLLSAILLLGYCQKQEFPLFDILTKDTKYKTFASKIQNNRQRQQQYGMDANENNIKVQKNPNKEKSCTQFQTEMIGWLGRSPPRFELRTTTNPSPRKGSDQAGGGR